MLVHDVRTSVFEPGELQQHLDFRAVAEEFYLSALARLSLRSPRINVDRWNGGLFGVGLVDPFSYSPSAPPMS